MKCAQNIRRADSTTGSVIFCFVSTKLPSLSQACVCNSCKMFFRRVILRKNIKDCENEGVCISKCRPCRFQKCLQAGMTFNPYSPTFDLHNNEVILFAIINNLQHIDNHREKLINNYLFNGDPSFTEVLGTLNFEEKPPDINYAYKEWSFIQSITGIDFLKKINFMKSLTLPDQIVVLKNIFTQFTIFSLAHSCYTTKQSRLSFPNGSEIPEPNIYGVSDNLRIRIQGRLLARLIDLKVSKQEFLLVSVLLLCNPCKFDVRCFFEIRTHKLRSSGFNVLVGYDLLVFWLLT